MYDHANFEKDDEMRPVVTDIKVKVGADEYMLVNLHTAITCGICAACDLKRVCDENHEIDDFCNKFIPTGWVFKKQ